MRIQFSRRTIGYRDAFRIAVWSNGISILLSGLRMDVRI